MKIEERVRWRAQEEGLFVCFITIQELMWTNLIGYTT